MHYNYYIIEVELYELYICHAFQQLLHVLQQRYDGDTEQSQRKTNVRATVDGNARRQSRRYSSDESAAQESSAEVETYLDQYQQSTPIKPGECTGDCQIKNHQ